MTTLAPVRLLPMVCVQCSQPIMAQPGEVAWVCTTCGRGMLLGNDGILKPIDVFFSEEIKPGGQGRPFWVSQGKVAITERQTYQGNSSREAEEFWGSERLLFIPAYRVSLDNLISVGMNLLKAPVFIQKQGSVGFLLAGDHRS